MRRNVYRLVARERATALYLVTYIVGVLALAAIVFMLG